MTEINTGVYNKNVFSPFLNAEGSSVNLNKTKLKPLTPDTVEFSNAKKLPKINKKHLFAAGAAVLLLALAFLKRKDIKNGIDNLISKYKMKKDYQKYCTDIAKGLLIPEKGDTIHARGICIWGPDSVGKEKAIEGFISDLSEGGYKIDRVPRTSEASVESITDSLIEKMQTAEQTFKDTKQRTAIIVRDMDILGLDRTKRTKQCVATLMEVEKCDERGYAWIWEAKDPSVVDPALRRPGRTDGYILAMPTREEGLDVWKAFRAAIVGDDTKKINKWYLKQADKMIKKLGGKIEN